MSISSFLRNYKSTYTIYNWLHQKQLQHNQAAYRDFGLRKALYQSLSSADFKYLPTPPTPWLDQPDEAAVMAKIAQSDTDDATKELLRTWRKQGYLIIKNFLSLDEVANINAEVEQLLSKQKVDFNDHGKIMFANKKSELIKQVISNKKLTDLLAILLGKPVIPFQTINFKQGSQQRAHSDSIHMTTYPSGYLAAAWFALEPVDAHNGPLFYYPGSHRLPYLYNDGYAPNGNPFALGDHAYRSYEDRLAEIIAQQNLSSQEFHAQTGDLLIWHANLIHGGKPIDDPQRTRKSMVAHYFAENVIKYHEITQRPALIDSNH